MELVNSFGIWAKYKDNALKSPVEVHANLWHIGKNTDNAFIDFGVMIPQYTDLLNLTIVLPFFVPTTNISDLSDIISQNGIGSLVFNTECAAQVKSGLGKIKITTLRLNNSGILLLPIVDKYIGNGISVSFDKIEEQSCISIDFSKPKTDCEVFEKLYLRFRIRDSEIKNSMFCKLNKKNKYLESAFTGTQIIDFMVNELRNIKAEINEMMTGKGLELVNLNKVHFFVMEPAENDVVTGNVECRRLEPGWKDYLNEGDYQENTLVYHWSKKAANEKDHFSNYSKLVKITSSETNYKLIAIYILIVVMLSVVAGFVHSGLNCLIKWILGALGSALEVILSYLSQISS